MKHGDHLSDADGAGVNSTPSLNEKVSSNWVQRFLGFLNDLSTAAVAVVLFLATLWGCWKFFQYMTINS